MRGIVDKLIGEQKPTVGRIVHVFNQDVKDCVSMPAIVQNTASDGFYAVLFMPHGRIEEIALPYDQNVVRGDLNGGAKLYWRWPERS